MFNKRHSPYSSLVSTSSVDNASSVRWLDLRSAISATVAACINPAVIVASLSFLSASTRWFRTALPSSESRSDSYSTLSTVTIRHYNSSSIVASSAVMPSSAPSGKPNSTSSSTCIAWKSRPLNVPYLLVASHSLYCTLTKEPLPT